LSLTDDPALRESVEAFREAERRRATPEAVADRRESRERYSGLGAGEALAVAREQLPALFQDKVFDTSAEALDAESVRPAGEFSAVVEHENGESGLLHSTVPVTADGGGGAQAAHDLTVQETPEGFEPKNPLAATRIGAEATDGVVFEDQKWSLELEGARAVEGEEVADRVFYANALPDSDLVVMPVPGGVETFVQVRSAESPERFEFRVDKPEGAVLRRMQAREPIPGDPPESIEIVRGKERLGIVYPPLTMDADGVAVPSELTIEGDRIVLSVPHRGRDVLYPLLADPVIVSYWYVQHQPWSAWIFRDYPSDRNFGAAWNDPAYAPGLYTSMPTGSGFLAWDRGEWTFKAPPFSFIYAVEFGNISHFPYASQAYHGITNWNNSAMQTETVHFNQHGQWGGYISSTGYAYAGIINTFCFPNCQPHPAAQDGNHAAWGIMANQNVLTGRNKAIVAMGWSNIYLSDRYAPTIETRPASSGWSNHEVRWLPPIRVSDLGLGVESASLSGAAAGNGTGHQGCGASMAFANRPPCPPAWDFGNTSYRLNEGITTLQLTARDIVGNPAAPHAWTERLDRTAPNVTFGGSLYRQRVGGSSNGGDDTLHDEAYGLTIQATDGVANPANDSQRRSGVRSARLEIQDGNGGWTRLADYGEQSCPGGNCGLGRRTVDFRPDRFPEGRQRVRAVVTDWAGNTATPEFTIDIQRAPRAGNLPYFSLVNQNLTDRLRLSVNTANGNLLVRSTDFQLAGIGLDLTLGRSYNSWDAEDEREPLKESDRLRGGEFGLGWKLSLGRSTRLRKVSNDVEFRTPDGARVRYRGQGDGGYRRPDGVHARLSDRDEGGWELFWYQAGVTWTFDADGTLTRIRDQNDNTMRLEYNSENGRLDRIVNGLGNDGVDRRRRVLDITAYTDAGFIEEIRDPQLDRTWRYTYADGRLASATDPAGHTVRYRYGSNGLLTEIEDALGGVTTVGYEAGVETYPRVTSVQRPPDSSGVRPTSRFEWDRDDEAASANLVFGPRHRDGFRVVTRYKTDKIDRVTDVTDPAGGDASRTYDEATGNLTGTAAGVDTSFGYDATGENVTEIAQGSVKTTLGYGDAAAPNYPTSSTDSRGNGRGYGYAARNLVSKRNTSSGASADEQASVTLPRTANGVGTVDKVTDGRGNTTDYTYTEEHEVAKRVPERRSDSSDEGVQRFEWDAASRVRSVTDGEGRKTTYSYDEMDRLLKAQWESGASVTFTYDANGNRLSMDDDRGLTTYTYDKLNRMASERRAGREVNAYTWDLAGNMASHTADGQTTRYDHDERDLPREIVDPDGKVIRMNYTLDSQKLASTRIEPDADGGGQAILIDRDYDGSGRIHEVRIVARGGDVLEHFEYGYADDEQAADDASSHLREFVRDFARDRCTNYQYDSLNRLIEARTTGNAQDCAFDADEDEKVIDRYEYAYDAASNLRRIERDGESTMTLRSNGRNELCWTDQGEPDETDCNDVPGSATDYDHDDAGGQTRAQGRYRQGYDERGRTKSVTADGQDEQDLDYAGLGQSQRTRAGELAFEHALTGIDRVSGP
jgi:YD repeat-containing protein